MTQLKLEGFAIFFSQHRCLSNKIKTNLITEMTMNEENKAADSLVFLYFCSLYFKTLKKLFKFPRKHIENLCRQIVPHGVIS